MVIINTKKGTFTYNDTIYDVLVIYKKGKKNTTFRFRDNTFVITTPPFTLDRTISDGLKKFAPRLTKYARKEKGIGSDYVYIFGHKVDKTTGKISFKDITIKFKDDKELKMGLKKILLDVVKDYTKYYQVAMKTSIEMKVSVKDMTTRYGSNSKRTNRISYALKLVHYDIEIIKAIVVHEVAHCIHFDHSKDFYKVVYTFCPNYKQLHQKLVKGEYK